MRDSVETSLTGARKAQCLFLLLVVFLLLAPPSLAETAYGRWPALGFAVAVFMLAGRSYRWHVAAAETVVITVALSVGYSVNPALGLLGSMVFVPSALLTSHLLGYAESGLRLAGIENSRYHLATAASALLAGTVAMPVSWIRLGPEKALEVGLLVVFAALTAQLTVLPLFLRPTRSVAAAGEVEMAVQRTLLAVLTVGVFSSDNMLALPLVILPVLGWGAVRARGQEAHVQLFLVCLTAYALTALGWGPLTGDVREASEVMAPLVLYVFMASASYLTVPITLSVDRLFAATTRATREAVKARKVMDSATGTLIVVEDGDRRVSDWNSGAQELLGWTLEEVRGRASESFHTAEEIARHATHFGVAPVHAEVVRRMLETGERRDWEFIAKDGTPRMASLRLTALTDDDGTVIGHISAGEDVSERLRVEDALLVALDAERASVLRLEEVDRYKQDLVSNVSHELRTPITSIAGYAELLADGDLGELSQAQSEAVNRIERNSQRLEVLVEDLLTLSVVESGQLVLNHTALDLRTLASTAVELLEAQVSAADIRLELTLDPDPVPVLGDAPLLERVVVNLVSNAIKFTPGNGLVRVSVACREHQAELVVQDTGMGISQQDQEHLFTRFFRSSAATDQAIQGSGLGLSIVLAIISQHGGSVSVDSTLGTGTTMTVLLPRLDS